MTRVEYSWMTNVFETLLDMIDDTSAHSMQDVRGYIQDQQVDLDQMDVNDDD